jgi:hypothetical protein
MPQVWEGESMNSGDPVWGEVKGTRFEVEDREYILVLTNEPRTYLHGWILRWDYLKKMWIAFRKATQRDIDQISAAVIRAHHSPERERFSTRSTN